MGATFATTLFTKKSSGLIASLEECAIVRQMCLYGKATEYIYLGLFSLLGVMEAAISRF